MSPNNWSNGNRKPRFDIRIDQEASSEDAGMLWTATNILMGLRYQQEFVESLLQVIRPMKESVTYQAILQEGFIKGEEAELKEGEARSN